MLISNGLAAPEGASGVLVDMLVVGWFFAAPVGGASYSLYWALRSSASGDELGVSVLVISLEFYGTIHAT